MLDESTILQLPSNLLLTLKLLLSFQFIQSFNCGCNGKGQYRSINPSTLQDFPSLFSFIEDIEQY